TAADDLGAVADLVLMDEAVEPVAVDVEPIWIDYRRGCRVAKTRASVDTTRPGRILARPNLRTGVGVPRDDGTGSGRDEEQVSRSRHCVDGGQKSWRTVGDGW